MIKQVSSLNTCSSAKDPRRKARTIQFKHSYNYSYSANPNDRKQEGSKTRSPVWTGTSIVLGSVLFLMIYFIVTGSRNFKK